jgi:hypothetical protein
MWRPRRRPEKMLTKVRRDASVQCFMRSYIVVPPYFLGTGETKNITWMQIRKSFFIGI